MSTYYLLGTAEEIINKMWELDQLFERTTGNLVPHSLGPGDRGGSREMDLIALIQKFPDQKACIEHLEQVRWQGEPNCPYCGSTNVNRKGENHRIGRWNCYDCHSSFNVLQGTIMQKTRIPLTHWFAAIALMINAKKGISSCQMARDLDMDQKTCWYMMKRIRDAMSREEVGLLTGIVEADETFIGASPGNSMKNWRKTNKRGRGTSKTTVIGVVARDGEVVAQIMEDMKHNRVLNFLSENVDLGKSKFFTDSLRAYNVVNHLTVHRVINYYRNGRHDGDTIHTNTIEGFWSLLKRAWYGQHHHYTVKHMPMYIAEACWKFNQRKISGDEAFDIFLNVAMNPQ